MPRAAVLGQSLAASPPRRSILHETVGGSPNLHESSVAGSASNRLLPAIDAAHAFVIPGREGILRAASSDRFG